MFQLSGFYCSLSSRKGKSPSNPNWMYSRFLSLTQAVTAAKPEFSRGLGGTLVCGALGCVEGIGSCASLVLSFKPSKP